MLVFSYCWRNLWRNSRRTVITMAAVSLNTAILILSYALMDGLVKQAISNTTNLVTGEIQIHAPGYLPRRSFFEFLDNPDHLVEKLHQMRIQAAARSYGFGLIAQGGKSAGALFWGIDPRAEQLAFDLPRHMAQGRFLSPIPEKQIVLGKRLAHVLNARIGSEIIVVVQAADGSLGNDLYQVSGILQSAGDRIDREAALLHQADFSELFVTGHRIHEIALNTRGKVPLDSLVHKIKQAAPQADIRTWRQLMPALSDMVNLFDVGIWIFGVIFFLAAGLGVLNTMLMATFERIREFGILKALGASPFTIVRDVALEAALLGLLAAIMGAVMGLAGALYTQAYGLDLGMFSKGYSLAGVAFDPVWRGAVSPKTVLIPALVMWGVCGLAALYPAVIAARLDPVTAIQHT